MSRRGSKRRIGTHDAIDSFIEQVCLQITEVHSDAEISASQTKQKYLDVKRRNASSPISTTPS